MAKKKNAPVEPELDDVPDGKKDDDGDDLIDLYDEADNLEEDIDYDLVEEWPKRLALYNYKNYSSIKKFHDDFTQETKSMISYGEFGNWVRGNVNYTMDPEHLYILECS